MKQLATILMTALLVGGANADERGVPEGPRQFGLRFWHTLSRAEFAQMEACYAPEVTLLAGSELLKNDWGINPLGGRDQDLLLKREKLLQGYKALVLKLGVEKWKKLFAEIPREKISFALVESNDQDFKGAVKDDMIMTVPFGDDEKLSFILRKDKDDVWSVAMERTDY